MNFPIFQVLCLPGMVSRVSITGLLFLNEIFSRFREQFQKLVAILIPIFGNVDGSWRVTSKLRGSMLVQVAQRRSKVFQRVSASLVQVGDVQGVS